jgi:hypothetical protein
VISEAGRLPRAEGVTSSRSLFRWLFFHLFFPKTKVLPAPGRAHGRAPLPNRVSRSATAHGAQRASFTFIIARVFCFVKSEMGRVHDGCDVLVGGGAAWTRRREHPAVAQYGLDADRSAIVWAGGQKMTPHTGLSRQGRVGHGFS